MDLSLLLQSPVIPYLASIAGGAGGSFLLMWLTGWMSRRKVRMGIQPEMREVLLGLNIFIVAVATNHGKVSDLRAKHIHGTLSLSSVAYYTQNKRDELLSLGEWKLLENWTNEYANIRTAPDPFFVAISFFRRLKEGSLNKCVDREIMRLVRRAWAQPEIQKYWTDRLLTAAIPSSLKGH